MCNQSGLQELLSVFARKMREIFGDKLKKVILFGSYARGDYDNESDIDVMVIVDMDKMEIKNYVNEVCSISSDIGLEHDVLLSLIIKSQQEFLQYRHIIPFLQNVEREGFTISA